MSFVGFPKYLKMFVSLVGFYVLCPRNLSVVCFFSNHIKKQITSRSHSYGRPRRVDISWLLLLHVHGLQVPGPVSPRTRRRLAHDLLNCLLRFHWSTQTQLIIHIAGSIQSIFINKPNKFAFNMSNKSQVLYLPIYHTVAVMTGIFPGSIRKHRRSLALSHSRTLSPLGDWQEYSRENSGRRYY